MANMMRFAATYDDPREYLRKPWRDGEWVYATNGHVCIRVRGDKVDKELPVRDKHPDAAAMFTKYEGLLPAALHTLPALPEAKKCQACEGRGWHWAKKCESCDGEGTFMRHGYEYNCQACEDEPVEPGWALSSERSGTRKDCAHCYGRGYERNQELAFGVQKWDLVYLTWLAELPDLKVRLTGNPEKASEYAALFTFDGGEALLMPRRY